MCMLTWEGARTHRSERNGYHRWRSVHSLFRGHVAIGEMEIDREVEAVLGLLPAADDRVAVSADGADESLRERMALSLERPLVAVKTHLVDAADSAVVGVELHERLIGAVASDDRDGVRSVRRLDVRALDQERGSVVPLECGSSASRQRFTSGHRGLQRPFPHEYVES